MPPVTYLEAIRRGIWEEMERDRAVFCIGEDIGLYGGAFKVTDGMMDRFGPERIIDSPIAESAIVGAAFGASLLGMRPVVEFQFMDFIGCAFNQITNMVAKAHYRWGAPAPIVLRGPSGGGVHGGPFHSQNPEMPFVHTPGLKVVCPGTPADAYGLIKSAIRDNNPVVFFEHKLLYRQLKEELPRTSDYIVPLGKARVARGGKHVSVITYGAMLQVALQAAEILANEGIELEVLDLRTLMPLDREAIVETVRKTSLTIILHEDTKSGGIAGEIAAIINEEAFDNLDGPIVRITSPDTPVPFSPQLERCFLPSVQDLLDKARWLKQQSEPAHNMSVPSRPLVKAPALRLQENARPGEIIPMSAACKETATRAIDSQEVSPHVYMIAEVDLSRIVRSLSISLPGAPDRRMELTLALVPFVAWAACRALQEYPALNSSVQGDSIRYHRGIRLAIESHQSSLLRTVIDNAQEKSIGDLQSEIQRTAGGSGSADIAARPPTFTISFCLHAVLDLPLIRQPQTAILALGALQKTAVTRDMESDNLSVAHIMPIVLGHDHRVVDGVPAAKYCGELKRLLASISV
jgi:2-oxoisovalerate dehydrogenase E1 component beta subunit